MKRIIALVAAIALTGCAQPYVEWTKTGDKPSDLPTAKTDCEFKLRQVAHTFGPYGYAAAESFVFNCMASHGFSGHWVQR